METMWKEAIVARLKVLSQKSPARTKAKPQKALLVPAGRPAGSPRWHILNTRKKHCCLNPTSQNQEDNVCLQFIH